MLTLVTGPEIGPPDARRGREVHAWRDEQGEVIARGFTNGAAGWIEWSRLGTFEFAQGSRFVRMWPAAGAQPQVVVDWFQRVLQPVILQALGWQALHASAVLRPSGALAFCGVRGSGKSTLSYALRGAGWTQIADDALVIGTDHHAVEVHPLPFVSKLREPARQYFGVRAGRFDTGDAAGLTAPLKAVVVLRKDEREQTPARIERVSLVPAFRHLLAHAHAFDATDPDDTRRLTDAYLTLVQRVPVFALTYRPDFNGLHDVLDAIEHIAVDLGMARAEPSAPLARV